MIFIEWVSTLISGIVLYVCNIIAGIIIFITIVDFIQGNMNTYMHFFENVIYIFVAFISGRILILFPVAFGIIKHKILNFIFPNMSI